MAKINPMRKFIIEKYRKGDPKVQVFYKYQSWRSYTVSTLSSNQIYLSKYHELNDPFDPFLPALKTWNPGKKIGADDNKSDLLEAISDASIFCLAEEADNQLLWAHYANSFRGFCLGYAVYMDALRILHQVKYSPTLPDVFIAKKPIPAQELLNTTLLTKPDVWAYEKEWRYIMSGDISLIDSLFPVVEVILGHRMNESDGRLLIESTKKSKPKLFEAGPVIRDGRYAISIDAIT